jgi:hypothetical protein
MRDHGLWDRECDGLTNHVFLFGYDACPTAFVDPSALLKHELAYVLGQMKNPYAIPILNKTLEDLTEDPMVRHEVCVTSDHERPTTSGHRKQRKTCDH